MEPAAVIAFNQPIADAYVQPARNVALPSMPGRQVKFLQGHAVIKDGRDLAAMLRRSDVTLVLHDYVRSWIDDIRRSAGDVRAEVRWPYVAPPPPSPLARKPLWDPSWPRDPKTGRLLPRHPPPSPEEAEPEPEMQASADSPEPDS
jgi:hypothetical protein